MNYYPIRCPECGELNALPLQELAVRGRTLARDLNCAHCGADLYPALTSAGSDADLPWKLENRRPPEALHRKV